MIKYIVGGVALVTAGYTLRRYLSKYDFHISAKNKNQNNTKQYDSNTKWESALVYPVGMNDDDFLEARVVEKSHKFNETINRLFVSLKSLQKKLSSVENLPDLKSAYSSISGEKVLRFKAPDAKNFSKFFYIFIDSKEDLQILCDLNLMIDYALERMIENNISKIDTAEQKVRDYCKFDTEQQEIIIKLVELNNVLVKALRELRSATQMKEIATIFKDVAGVYKRYYDKKFFKEKLEC
ncbi:hypothetical protein [uncultured Campylobacter sp.]|uniref:hypothetical protein n=1 Tax=uncultured Campylobacter sp. TaxID=218934 RepID=UPI00262C5D21|nr:hypothetical protein [uncultured Campylobacter sp.]